MDDSQPMTVVIGCGRQYAGDAAVGLEVITRLRNLTDLECELRSYENELPSGSLAQIPDRTVIVFIDMVRSKALPGTICCLKLPTKSVICPHLLNLERELEEVRTIHGRTLRTFLVGIEAAEGATAGGLSSRVQLAVNEITENFQRYLSLAHNLA